MIEDRIQVVVDKEGSPGSGCSDLFPEDWTKDHVDPYIGWRAPAQLDQAQDEQPGF